MTFRPLPILTLAAIPVLIFLLLLGNWQLDRRAWKANMIGQFEATAALPAGSLSDIICGEGDALGHAVLPVRPVNSADLKFYGVGPQGAPGWRIFQAIAAPDCLEVSHVLIEVRFEPLMAARAEVDGQSAIVSVPGTWRLERPQEAGAFSPANVVDKGEYYAFDPAMAETLQLDGTLSPDWWVVRDTGALPAHLTQTPPERHVGYAVTWFLMAVALIAIYILFHVRAGRLRFGQTAT